MMQLTKNFNIREFACKDGTPVPGALFENVYRLAVQLQKLRDRLGVPIVINSGYRSPSYNARIGGAPRSQHLEAKAADIRTASHTPQQLAAIIEDMIAKNELHFGGIGIYNTFVHVDIRTIKTRWNG